MIGLSLMQQSGEVDPNTVIWRYLISPEFVSLVETKAVLHSMLQVFDDALECVIPDPVRSR
jgi:hypothetical protein